MNDRAHNIWTEKYRPYNLNDYLFPNDKVEARVTNWVKKKQFPHLLIYGKSGTGKTSLVRMLCNELDINDEIDVLTINAGDYSGIDLYRTRIKTFTGTMPMSRFRVIHLEEAESMSKKLMDSLKAEMEASAQYCKFVLTVNDPSKIIDAIKSRCVILDFDRTSSDVLDHVVIKLEEVLSAEGIDYDRGDLVDVATDSHPDIRKALIELQEIYDTACELV